MKFREATDLDFSGIMRLYRQLQPADPILTDGKDRSVFDEIINDERLHLFVLDDDGETRATCYLNVIPNITRSARSYAIVENVVTDERVRGQGLGKKIMQNTLEFAWSQGCYKVMLQTGSQRESTQEFYNSCGFSGDDKHAFVAWLPTSLRYQ